MTKQYHPYPWTADKGRILEANSWVIGNYPFTLGDELDHASGELMAKAPELLEAAKLAHATIREILLTQPLSPGGAQALQSTLDKLAEVIQ